MKSIFRYALLAALLVPALGSCASTRLSDSDKLDLYRANAGAPVDSFQYFGHIDGWTPLGDSTIAVWTRPSQAYLLELYGPCQDIEYTPVISITNQSNRVYAKFDKVIAHDRSAIQIPCSIREIRALDVKAVKQAEKSVRDQAQASGT